MAHVRIKAMKQVLKFLGGESFSLGGGGQAYFSEVNNNSMISKTENFSLQCQLTTPQLHITM